MNRDMILRWNSRVGQYDTVYYLGDFVMSPAHYLKIADRLNGKKFLVPGNHDHPFFGKKIPEYSKYFEILPKEVEMFGFLLCHLPYAGDHPDYQERYKEFRPVCAGLDLLCGHIHDTWKIKWHGASIMLNVGADVHDFQPILLEEARAMIDEYRQNTPKGF